MARTEALQNVRVWARRLHVEYEEAKASNFMDDFYPGSVLIGPLTYLFAKRNDRDIKLGAIQQRNAEKARPNLVNHILNRARER